MTLKLHILILHLSVILLAQVYRNVHGENILFFHLVSTTSHRTSIWPLAEALANRGHNVTYIFPMDRRPGSHPKIEEILPSDMVPVLMDFVGDFDINFRLNNSLNDFYIRAFSKSFDLCELFYDSPEVKDWLSRPNLHYDLLFVDTSMGECIYGLVHMFKAKLILFAPAIPPFLWDDLGIVPESASVPNTIGLHSKPSEMGFLNRLKTAVGPLLWRLGYIDWIWKLEPFIKQKLNLTDMPSISEIQSNASLVMINFHFVEDYPMALPPSVISYSGLSCSKNKVNERKELPEKLAKFIEKSDGFVYVSLGSAVVASAMPVELRNKFFEAFSSLPHLKFFWRWTGSIPDNAPKNVHFETWFPQQDILAHPKIKGFLMQAGKPSIQEGLCFGVPLITIPIFADQDYNADRLEYIGAAINLDINELTSERLVESIEKVTETDKYSKRMKELSAMFRNRPIDPLDNVLYWTEYALKHDTSLLRPLGIHRFWWQRRLLDVYAALLAIVIISCGFVLALTHGIFRFSRHILSFRESSKHKTE